MGCAVSTNAEGKALPSQAQQRKVFKKYKEGIDGYGNLI
jgi:hypothetical protein